MKTILRVRNWDDFQHYRDRDPLWIKLYGRLLDDADFLALPEAAQAQLVKLWLVASRSRNIIHDDRAFLRFSLHTKRLYVEELVAAGFLERVPKEAATPATRADWASRHVAPDVRARVLATTGGLCAKCQGGENIEIDHVIPVSRGGSSDEANLQPLCRKCNRAKRVKVEQPATQDALAVEQKDTPHAYSREEEGEGEGEQSLLAAPPAREASPTIELVRAANQAITQRWGEPTSPMLASHGKTHELAAAVLGAGIPIEFAQRSIARQVLAKGDGQPKSMAYFRSGILDDWAKRQAVQDAEGGALITPLELAKSRRPDAQSIAEDATAAALRSARRLQEIATRNGAA